MRNYLIFAGKDSRDFGVYISGQGTFSAPEKAYQFYDIPGRNGDVIGNDHRLQNIEVSYECFIYRDFNQNIAEFRTFLLSLNGYQRLEDSYHPDEYRMAAFVGPFDPEVTSKNDAGAFTLTFNCKPQRWLISGETVYDFTSTVVSGSEILAYSALLDNTVFKWTYSHHTLDGDPETDPSILMANHSMKRIRVDLNGVTVCDYDYANNKQFYWPNYTECEVDLITGVITSTPDAFLGGIVKQGWQKYTDRFWYHDFTYDQFYGCSTYKRVYASNINAAIPKMREYNHSCYYDETNKLLYIYTKALDENATAQDVADYLGDCGVVWDVKFSTGATHTLNSWVVPTFPGTQFINIADGYNKNAATFTIQYIENDSMYNPTYFPSAPIIRVYGTGSFEMDGVTVTISDCNSYVDIDCELMDCYEGSINRNKDVSFSTYDFPRLLPGSNVINVISGITVVEIVPRWFRV